MKNLVKTLCCIFSASLIASGIHARDIHPTDSVGNAGWNIQTVGTELITTVKDANFINSLSGKVAGLIINPNAAGLGSASRITMRGPASMNGYDPVLIVIDGIPMHNASSGNMTGGIYGERTGSDGIADINPEDIEGISVISGPSAAVLYGYEALHGAILINLKKGRSGKTEINFSNNTSFSSVIRRYEFQNSYANLENHHASWGEKMAEPTSFTPYDFFNTGYSTINSLSISHGSEHNQTYASAAATNTAGIIPTSGYNRYNFTLRNTLKIADDRLVIDLGARFISQDHKNLNADGLYYNPLPALYLMPRGEDFQQVQIFERWNPDMMRNEQYWPSELFPRVMGMQNPYWILNRITDQTMKQRRIIQGSIRYRITDWLEVYGGIKADSYIQNSESRIHAGSDAVHYTKGNKAGYYKYQEQWDKSMHSDLKVNFNKTWNDWNIHGTVGGTFKDISNSLSTTKGGLYLNNVFSLSNLMGNTIESSKSSWLVRNAAAYATVGASWKNMIFVDIAGRNDWTTFLEDAEYESVFYPSAGLSFVASELFDIPQIISYLRIRGNMSEAERFFDHDQLSITNISNQRIGKASSQEAGLDLRMFKDRFSIGVTWYNSVYSGQLLQPRQGYLADGGITRNTGIEGTVGYSDSYAGGKVRLATNLTLSHNRNSIEQLIDLSENPEIELKYLSQGSLGRYGNPEVHHKIGGTINDLYTNQALRVTSNGYIWQDENGKVRIDILDEWMHLGSTLPKFIAGWNTSLSYGGINLFVQFSGRFGGVAVSDTRAMMDRYGVSQETADARDNGGVHLGLGMIADPHNYYETISEMPGTYYVYDATNIRLSELSLSYDLPKKWFKDRVGLTIGLTGRNLCMIYCKAPFDPEMTAAPRSNFYQGFDCFMTPATRSLGFNIRLRFQ